MTGQARSLLGSLLILTSLFSGTKPALAGWLLSPSLGWGMFAFRPLQEEKTPNYYGISVQSLAGYSFSQKFDLALYGCYAPGRQGAARLAEESASLLSYGLQVSLRLREKILLGLRGGGSRYRLITASGAADEVSGSWPGRGGGLVLGALIPIDKHNFWELSVEMSQLSIEVGAQPNSDQSSQLRMLDSFRLALSYTFNSFISHQSSSNLFKNIF